MERYYFIDSWDNLQDGEHQAVMNFALKLSKELNTKLSVCVHSKSHCDQFLKKCFPSESQASKLLRGQRIVIQGVSVMLKSLKTLNNQSVLDTEIYLALFPSKDLMSTLDRENTNAAALIVFSESQHSEHLVEWIDEYQPARLKIGE